VNDKNVMKDADDFYKTDFFYTLTNVLYVKMLISANDIQAQKDIERYNKEYKDWQNSGGSNNQGENSKPPPEPLKLWEKEKYADKLSKFDKDIKDYKETFNRLIIKINDNARKARIEITKNRSKFEKIEKDLKALKTKVEALPNNQEFKPTMKKEIEDLLEDVKRERLDELTKAFTKTEEACRYISGNGSTSMIDKFGNELKPIEDKIKNKEITVKLSDKDRKDLYRYMKDGTINSATADAIVLGKVGINNNDVKNKIINKLKPTFQKHFVNSNSLTKSNRKSFTFELEVKLKAPQFDTESGIWKEILDTFKELKKMADDSSLSNIKAPLYGEKAKVSRGDLPTNSKYEVPADDEDPETSKVINSPESNANKLSDSAIDKVYLVEYLMSNFKSMIEDTEGGAKRVPVMPEGDTALRNEVEAILFQKKGEFSDKRAVDKMTNRLLFERAALNLVGFFCDSKKIKLVRDISLAISGGFAPLTICFAAIITTGWVGYESLLDVKDLLRGGNVPLIKNKDNWIAKITIGVDENNGLIDRLPSSGNQDDLFRLNGGDGDFYNEQNKLNFNYNDYLRMNLLVAKDAELINGMKDLIVKNMRMEDSEFAFHDKFTKINLEVDSRMELLFDMTAFGGKSGTINFKKINMNKGYN
ncbi:MAG: DUF5702 domain-containing protein, partial [Clostridium chrysemydis]|uniref:DUF5702 domain-containing protein n=1 Tax=Clostridium chrysemydis TaxID=2665504 RepID=UPI003F361659